MACHRLQWKRSFLKSARAQIFCKLFLPLSFLNFTTLSFLFDSDGFNKLAGMHF